MANKKPALLRLVALGCGLLAASVMLGSAVGQDATPAATAAASASAEPRGGELDVALAKLERAVSRAGGALGVAVIDVHSGQRLVSHQADKPLNPASNMKLVTAWAALHLLGPDHRYLTTLHGSIEGSRVDPLTLRGDGDPGLEMEHLLEMVTSLVRAGVKEVGDVVVDQSYFDDDYVPPSYAQQPNEWASFRAPVAAVSFSGNALLIEVRAGRDGQDGQIAAVPTSFVDVSGRVRTTGSDDPEAVTLSLQPVGARLQARLGGSVPQDTEVVRFWRRVDDPRLLAGYALVDACRGLGIEVDGQVRAGKAPRDEVLSSHRSLPLAQLLHALGKDSNNFYAEMVFKGLGAGDRGQPASYQSARARVRQLLEDHELAEGIDARNGSGLFDGGTLSARAVVHLLAAAHADPRVGPELVSQLSIGGTDGTLRHRLRPWRASRAIRAKSGTLAAVSALSGYVLGPSGRTLAFSVLVNDVRGKAVPLRTDMDAFVSAVAKQVATY